MAIPKGNFVALQPLKPVENRVGSIVSDWVDKFVAEGRAEQAAKLKALQERKASTDAYFKEFKIDPKETDKFLTDANFNLTTEVGGKIGNYGRLASEAKTDFERNQYMLKAKKLYDNYKFYQTALGSQQFLNGIKEAREFAASGDAFDDTEQTRLIKAYEGNLYKIGTDDNGNIKIYAHTGANLDDPPKEYSLSEVMQLATAKPQRDLLEDTKSGGKGLYSDMQGRAKLFTEEWQKNPTGDRKTGAKTFVRERAGIDFDTKYGAFNANRPINSMEDLANMEYGQFAIKTIGKIPESEEEHNKVRDAYITKMETFAPIKASDIVETSQQAQSNFMMKFAADQEERNRRHAETMARIARGGNGGSGGGGATQINIVPMKDIVPVQWRDKSGNYLGIQNTAMRTFSLPKLKGQPASDNTYGVSFYQNKNGSITTQWNVGTAAKNGKMVYAPVSESDFVQHVSKLGYNPIQIKSMILNADTGVPMNRRSGQFSKNALYDNTQIYLKTKDLSSGDDF